MAFWIHFLIYFWFIAIAAFARKPIQHLHNWERVESSKCLSVLFIFPRVFDPESHLTFHYHQHDLHIVLLWLPFRTPPFRMVNSFFLKSDQVRNHPSQCCAVNPKSYAQTKYAQVGWSHFEALILLIYMNKIKYVCITKTSVVIYKLQVYTTCLIL